MPYVRRNTETWKELSLIPEWQEVIEGMIFPFLVEQV